MNAREPDTTAQVVDEAIQRSIASGETAATGDPVLDELIALLHADAQAIVEMPNAKQVRARVLAEMEVGRRGIRRAATDQLSPRRRFRRQRTIAAAVALSMLSSSVAVAHTDTQVGEAVRKVAHHLPMVPPPRSERPSQSHKPKHRPKSPAAPSSPQHADGAATQGQPARDEARNIANPHESMVDAERLELFGTPLFPELDGGGEPIEGEDPLQGHESMPGRNPDEPLDGPHTGGSESGQNSQGPTRPPYTGDGTGTEPGAGDGRQPDPNQDAGANPGDQPDGSGGPEDGIPDGDSNGTVKPPPTGDGGNQQPVEGNGGDAHGGFEDSTPPPPIKVSP